VAQLGRPVEVVGAFGRLDLVAQPLDLRAQRLQLLDRLPLGLPLRGHRVGLRAQLGQLKQVHRDAVQHTGREPSRAELAERSGLSIEQVEDLLATEGPPRSLEEPVGGADGDIGSFGELLVDPLAEEEYERVLATIEVEELHTVLAGLSDREREVLRARFGLDADREERSLREVGEQLGLSGERVRQIERRALGKLAAAMQAPTGGSAR
jgi:DNA-directed RNA polymerase sigma subunit (sigma70/sigma32)